MAQVAGGAHRRLIKRYGVDAYFLDIVGGHVNSPNGDMHDGTRRLVDGLAREHPGVLRAARCPTTRSRRSSRCTSGLGGRWASTCSATRGSSSTRAHPAPGRGSSGVHESGFNTWDAQTLSLRAGQIPTLNVVDDTFTTYRAEMAAVIAKAKDGLGANAAPRSGSPSPDVADGEPFGERILGVEHVLREAGDPGLAADRRHDGGGTGRPSSLRAAVPVKTVPRMPSWTESLAERQPALRVQRRHLRAGAGAARRAVERAGPGGRPVPVERAGRDDHGVPRVRARGRRRRPTAARS